MPKFVLLQTVATDYRKKLFDTLLTHLHEDFLLFAGDDYFEPSVKTDNSISYLNKTHNMYFFNRKFLLQLGMWNQALKADILVMEMNPRILSNWILMLIRKITGKKTVLWGHAWPRNGQYSRSDVVRHKMRQLADVIITYTKVQSLELQKKMPQKKIVFAPNSLYYKDEMMATQSSTISDIIYVGRLTKSKKAALLIESYSKIIDQLPKNSHLVIVGDGEEKRDLEALIQKLKLEKRIKLLGHIGDYKQLKALYEHALFSVSPGYVGLSITQSFGFGVPMLISKDENHSPEIEAAIEEENSLFFETDNTDALAAKILLFYKNQDIWVKKREEICHYCKEKYSIEAMAQTFLDLA